MGRGEDWPGIRPEWLCSTPFFKSRDLQHPCDECMSQRHASQNERQRYSHRGLRKISSITPNVKQDIGLLVEDRSDVADSD